MAYTCRMCGVNEVERDGDICELCAVSMDPYASAMPGKGPVNGGHHDGHVHGTNGTDYGAHSSGSNSAGKGKRKVLIGGGSSISNNDPYGNSVVTIDEEPKTTVQVVGAGQVPGGNSNHTNTAVANTGTSKGSAGKNSKANKAPAGPICQGVTKNIVADTQKKSFLEKWFLSLFSGAPFAMSDDVTMFQVFPDYTGTSLNAMGYACDQVIVYGKVNAGAIAENNDVEVYGTRDRHNNIIASKIINRASGTTVTPNQSMPAGMIRGMTAFILLLLLCSGISVGVEGIVWFAVILLCLTNLPLVTKIIGVIFGALFSFTRRK